MKKNLILGLFLVSVLLMSVVGVSAQEITGEVVITGNLVNTGYSCGSDNDCDNAGPYSAASSCGSNKNCVCAAAVDGGAKTCFQPSPVAPGGNVGTTPTRTSSTGTSPTTGTETTSVARTGTSRAGTKTSPSASVGRAPGRGWIRATTSNDEECWIKSSGSGRRGFLSGRFLGKLFE